MNTQFTPNQLARLKMASVSQCMLCKNMFMRRDLRQPSVCSNCHTQWDKAKRIATDEFRGGSLAKRQSISEAERQRILRNKDISYGPYFASDIE